METVIIVGSGCAGLTAAIYLARAGLAPLVLDGEQPGGQLLTTTVVENFPGFPDGIGGFELMERMRQQAVRFGARFASDSLQRLSPEAGETLLHGISRTYRCRALILATGSKHRTLNIPGEDSYFGRGVGVCATCDGALYRNRDVAVIGGGDAAAEEAIFLSTLCKTVHLIHRRDTLRASHSMAERLFARANVIPVLDTVPREFLGEGGLLTGIALENVKTKKTSLLSCAGAFIAIGRVPNSNFAGDVLPRDGSGHFLGIPPDFVSTPVPGIFLAGDCQDRAYRQAIVAAGAGCKAALCAEKWLRGGD